MSDLFFPSRPATTPTIYAFASTHPDHAGLLKVGYTEQSAAERIAQQFPGGFTGYDIKLIEPAMRSDGSSFLPSRTSPWRQTSATRWSSLDR